MIKFFTNNPYKKCKLTATINEKQLIKRTMLTSAKRFADRATAHYSLKINPHNNFILQKRDYAYQGRKWDINMKKPSSPHIREDINLLEHQATHINIEHTDTETIVMLLTSSKGLNCMDKNIIFEKLSPIKADGSFTPLKDKSGNFILDVNGNSQPDPNKGGQYVAVLKYPRKLGSDIRRHVPIDPKLKAYLDQHEPKLDEILQKAKSKYNNFAIPKIVGDKDAE